MPLTPLTRRVFLPLLARKRRSRHLAHLAFLDRSQWDPPAVVHARQLTALRAVLRHAWATVPYYRRAWSAAGVHPDDLHTVADLHHFPVLTKSDIRRHAAELRSSAFDPRTLRTKRTSGSTGVPLTVWADEPAIQWKTACTLRADQWSGYRLGQRVAKLWGGDPPARDPLRRLVARLTDRDTTLDTRHVTPANLDAFAAALRRHPPGLLFGHAHSLYLLAAHLRRPGAGFRPGGIVSTCMPLPQWQRVVIEAVFGVPVTDRYGCEEVSLIASECERHRGLHVAAENVVTEVEPSGHLLVTDLANRAMPLIRYRVGDVVTPTGRRCPCGRGLPLLERVEGRDADFVLTPSGALVSGISLTEHFALRVPGARQVQLVQESLTRLRVRLAVDDGFAPDGPRRVAELVGDLLGDGMRHELEIVDAIPPEPGGKYRFCVSAVAAEHLRGMAG